MLPFYLQNHTTFILLGRRNTCDTMDIGKSARRAPRWFYMCWFTNPRTDHTEIRVIQVPSVITHPQTSRLRSGLSGDNTYSWYFVSRRLRWQDPRGYQFPIPSLSGNLTSLGRSALRCSHNSVISKSLLLSTFSDLFISV